MLAGVDVHTIGVTPLGLLAAFGAGMLSFLSPCVLPLVPGYVSMVSGLSAAELSAGNVAGGAAAERGMAPVLRGTVGFVAGFTLVFTVLGAAASGLGQLLRDHHRARDIAAGAAIIVMGAWMVGFGTPGTFRRERRFHPLPSKLGPWAPPVMGMAFAFGWTPCIGPVLSGVLGLAATRSTLASGLLLLVVYSLGLGVPFLATGLAFDRLTGLWARMRRRLGVLEMVAGSALVAFGLLLLTGQLSWLSAHMSGWLSDVGLQRLTVS